MIPQRNLSLLSNRLAKDGGRRIPESALERDDCLAWFPAAPAESDLKAALGFKGRTALKRCYFGDYRFSEDLDFTLAPPCKQFASSYSFAGSWAAGDETLGEGVVPRCLSRPATDKRLSTPFTPFSLG
jgi:hypothetical protein